MKYKLDMITDKVLPVIHISQYDSSRTIVFNLYENGVEYIPTDAKISLNDKRNDKRKYIHVCSRLNIHTNER